MGFVKGVVWDPAGQYLATQVSPLTWLTYHHNSISSGLTRLVEILQSDDNSLKIWNTEDWSLKVSVEAPFVDAPKATTVRPSSVETSPPLPKKVFVH